MRQKILKAIDKDAKLSAEDLAVMLDSTEGEISQAIQEMEKEGVICGYPTLIDWDKVMEEKVTALIELKVTPQRGLGFDRIAERIYQFEQVETLYLMSGGFDLAVIIKGRSMREVASFVSEKLATMEAVISTSTHFVLKKYKEHGIQMHSEESDERISVTP